MRADCPLAVLPDVSGLATISVAAAASVNKRLMSLLFDRYNLLDHLNALKRFMLLAEVRRIEESVSWLGASVCRSCLP